ncbi:MAG: SGNH/GDSL hydrolase family protein [Phycisphaerae bacterium]|nr:SGNH/GDSL hydrolase family protein [Phycisphaerae bacterium]
MAITGIGLLSPDVVLKKVDAEEVNNPLSIAEKQTYLGNICQELSVKWPKNRSINIVFHGHSVPSGYFATPVVDTFNAYPHLFHVGLKQRYPYSVVNVIVTAIGGENSIKGSKRFARDVLCHKPDVLLIDYALNDRAAGLADAKSAWESMIEQALEKNIKVILLTPSIDVAHVVDKSDEPLNQHAQQIRQLAKKYNVGMVDSLATFDTVLVKGIKTKQLLSNGYNHPNRRGHDLIAEKILEWFPTPSKP